MTDAMIKAVGANGGTAAADQAGDARSEGRTVSDIR